MSRCQRINCCRRWQCAIQVDRSRLIGGRNGRAISTGHRLDRARRHHRSTTRATVTSKEIRNTV